MEKDNCSGGGSGRGSSGIRDGSGLLYGGGSSSDDGGIGGGGLVGENGDANGDGLVMVEVAVVRVMLVAIGSVC